MLVDGFAPGSVPRAARGHHLFFNMLATGLDDSVGREGSRAHFPSSAARWAAAGSSGHYSGGIGGPNSPAHCAVRAAVFPALSRRSGILYVAIVVKSEISIRHVHAQIV